MYVPLSLILLNASHTLSLAQVFPASFGSAHHDPQDEPAAVANVCLAEHMGSDFWKDCAATAKAWIEGTSDSTEDGV